MAYKKAVQTEAQREYQERTPSEHNGMKKGDLVKVERERGTFTFMYATIREDGTLDSYTVYGGLKGRTKTRTFLPNRVSPDKVKQRLRKKED